MLDSLKEDVIRLATPRGRMVGTHGHVEARQYLLDRCRELGLEGYHRDSYELAYAEGDIRLTNVLAVLPGSEPELAPVLIAAHYDTCGPLPGADDNASAIAIALASAPLLRARALRRSVIYAFFDAEEPPHFHTPMMGSTYFYEHQMVSPVHCALVLDLLGHDVPVPGMEDLVFIMGMESDPGLERVVRGCEAEPGMRTMMTLNRYVGDMSDHHVFRLNERPYLFLSCGQWEHYHLATDTPEKLNYAKMAAITSYLVRLTAAVAEETLAGPFEGYDTTETELSFMRQHAGHIASRLGISLDTRRGLEQLVFYLVSTYGLLTER